MVARDPAGRARRRPAQIIRRWSPLAKATIPAPTTSRPAATNIGPAWVSTTIAASASEMRCGDDRPEHHEAHRPSQHGRVGATLDPGDDHDADIAVHRPDAQGDDAHDRQARREADGRQPESHREDQAEHDRPETAWARRGAGDKDATERAGAKGREQEAELEGTRSEMDEDQPREADHCRPGEGQVGRRRNDHDRAHDRVAEHLARTGDEGAGQRRPRRVVAGWRSGARGAGRGAATGSSG